MKKRMAALAAIPLGIFPLMAQTCGTPPEDLAYCTYDFQLSNRRVVLWCDLYENGIHWGGQGRCSGSGQWVVTGTKGDRQYGILDCGSPIDSVSVRVADAATGGYVNMPLYSA